LSQCEMKFMFFLKELCIMNLVVQSCIFLILNRSIKYEKRVRNQEHRMFPFEIKSQNRWHRCLCQYREKIDSRIS